MFNKQELMLICRGLTLALDNLSRNIRIMESDDDYLDESELAEVEKEYERMEQMRNRVKNIFKDM